VYYWAARVVYVVASVFHSGCGVFLSTIALGCLRFRWLLRILGCKLFKSLRFSSYFSWLHRVMLRPVCRIDSGIFKFYGTLAAFFGRLLILRVSSSSVRF